MPVFLIRADFSFILWKVSSCMDPSVFSPHFSNISKKGFPRARCRIYLYGICVIIPGFPSPPLPRDSDLLVVTGRPRGSRQTSYFRARWCRLLRSGRPRGSPLRRAWFMAFRATARVAPTPLFTARSGPRSPVPDLRSPVSRFRFPVPGLRFPDSFRHSPVNPCHSLEFPVFRFPDV